MKALYFPAHGGVEQLKFGELRDPAISPGHVLIRVRACALNHLDLFVLEGWPGLKVELPHIGGSDIAGEIAALGEGVTGRKIGDRAALTPGFIPSGAEDEWTKRGEDSVSPLYRIFGENIPGGLAEYVLAPAHTLLPLPEELSFSAAAAPLLVATTAWRMLRTRANLKSGETVLIVGAGGGLNSFCILLAKSLGAFVIALTGSKEKVAKASALGADEVLNYRDVPEWSKEIRRMTGKRGVDVVIDNVGIKTFSQSLLAARRGGRIVTVGNTSGPEITFDNRLVFGKQLSILGSTMGSARDAHEAIQFAWANKPERLIDREMPLAEGKKAYQILQDGLQFGKVVLYP